MLSQPKQYLLRLDLEALRRNLEATAEAPQSIDDVLRLLAGLGVWRQSDQWWGAGEGALVNLREAEVLEKRPWEP